MQTRISFVNESTVATNEELAAAVAAFQIQLTRDLFPAWGMTASLRLALSAADAHGDWVIAILDDSDQADALGYHDITSSGQPLAKVFAKSCKEDGLSWTVTASHELIEMLGDPEINEAVFNQTGDASGTIYARELCDAPEADQYGYEINGVKVSDFVLPAWFSPAEKGRFIKYDFCGHIKQAFELLPGGYIGAFPIPNNGSGWTQIQHAEQGKPGMRKPGLPEHSRRARRLVLKDKLRKSSAV